MDGILYSMKILAKYELMFHSWQLKRAFKLRELPGNARLDEINDQFSNNDIIKLLHIIF